MSNIAFAAHEVARSYEVFADPVTYRGFDLTSDHRRIIGCIDPRDEDTEGNTGLKVIVQTGGGAAGQGLDAQLSLVAGSRAGEVPTIHDGLVFDSDSLRTTVAGAHNNVCRFIYGLGSVASEMMKPTDFTLDTVSSFISRYELRDSGIEGRIRRISAAVERVYDQLTEVDPAELLGDINNLYPYHPNVRDMKGDNRAGFYIINHHPYVGLNRSLVHRGGNPLTVHAYHDSLRAMMDILNGKPHMPIEIKALRLGSLLLRTAATRTVLCAGSENMRLLNVVPTKEGLQVQEEFR